MESRYAFLRGFGRDLDLFGMGYRPQTASILAFWKSIKRSDAQAIRGDWAVVGSDIGRTMAEYREGM